jgi:hypothetical protein
MNSECSFLFSFLLLGYSQLSGRTNHYVLNKDAELLLNILKKEANLFPVKLGCWAAIKDALLPHPQPAAAAQVPRCLQFQCLSRAGETARPIRSAGR